MENSELKNKYKKIQGSGLSLADKIKEVFSGYREEFNLELLYEVFEDEKKTTLRGRVYRELIQGGEIRRLAKGVYKFSSDSGEEGVIVQGDARKLDMLKDCSVELVVADHPYRIAQGGNRSFNSNYAESTFRYEQEDFREKARVLKDGCFLVEFLPEMKENNWEYITEILQMAKKAGFRLYLKASWHKAQVRGGKLVDQSAFVGRKAVCEDVYIFFKGKRPRKLRVRKQGGKRRLEAGAKEMFPAVLMHSPAHPSKRAHKAQKPDSLLGYLLENLTLKGEMVLDQFSGSLNLFFKALAMGRKCLAIEKGEDILKKSISARIRSGES